MAGVGVLVGQVVETFEIQGRGVVVSTDTTYEQLPREVDSKLKIGHLVELRIGGEVVLRSRLDGIEHCDPWSPTHAFGFLIRDLNKADVPIGAEVWSVD